MIYRVNSYLFVALLALAGYGTTALAKTHEVTAAQFAFEPAVVKIQPGDTVEWTNMNAHNVNSYGDEQGLIPEGAEDFKSKLGEDYSVTLEEEGVYVYVCDPHASQGMVGAIIVGEPENLDEVTEKADGVAERGADMAKSAAGQ